MPSDVAAPADLMSRLKTETRSAHDATESVVFSTAMVKQTLPRDVFIQHLHCMAAVHDALEQHLATKDDPAVRAIWQEDLAKAPLLRRDLDALEGVAIQSTHPALVAAARFVEDINTTAETDPTALLGFLYVLEGSTLGGSILRTHINAMYSIDETSGASYFWPYGKMVMPHWQQFKARMNSLVLSDVQQNRIIDVARRAFDHVGAILGGFAQQVEQTT